MSRTRKPQSPSIRRIAFIPTAITFVALIALFFWNGGADELIKDIGGSKDSGGSASTDVPSVNAGDTYYEVTGTAQREYEATAGQIDYCELDRLERATCAYGELTHDLRAGERGADREDITKDPAGWGDNSKVEISSTDGEITYRGYMFNRSHLVADSLGGSPDMVNMVTGTRTQNVGFNNSGGSGNGGMAYTETIARDYLDSDASKDCSLYYAATPNYSGDELLPRTVTVDIQSCDKSIDERVVVPNTANGYTIDYTDGTFEEAA